MTANLRRYLWIAATPLAAALLALALAGPLEGAGWFFFDFLERRSALPASEGVALVLVDQESIDRLAAEDLFFPWPRELYGAVARVAKEAHARAVAYDILFTEPSLRGVADDRAFAGLIRESGLPTVMPAASVSKAIKPPTPLLASAVTALGDVDILSETGVYRNASRARADGTPTLAEQAYRLGYRAPIAEVADARFLRFYRRDAIPRVSFYNVVRDMRRVLDGKPLSGEVAALRDKVWLVGYSAPGLMDLKPTPLEPKESGTLVHATMLANFVQDQGVYPVSRPHLALLAFGFCLLGVALVLFPKRPVLSLLLGPAVLLFGSPLLSAALWLRGAWLNPLVLVVAVGPWLAAVLTQRFRVEWKDRLRIAKSLEFTMSPEMLALIRSGDVEVNRGGESRVVTVMFSDLANFTTLSEQVRPEVLVELLSHYLDEVVDLIIANGGYVDKFIGDAVMALWGAPVADPSLHATKALRAAVAFEEAVERFQRKLGAEHAGLELYARVGVHSGSAIVGNIGSRNRYNYTAIGDNVNLASRLEGLGKQYHTRLIISDQALLHASVVPPGIYEIDEVRVKGRSQPTKIFSHAPEAHRQEIAAYQAGLAAYRREQWREALELFKRAMHLGPHRTLLQRCELSLQYGTLRQYDKGVWQADEK